MIDENIIASLRFWASHSTCSAKQIGCVIFEEPDNYILSSGYNTSVINGLKCTDLFMKKNGIWYDKRTNEILKDQELHNKWSQENEIHAEMAALMNLSRITIDVSMICTFSPCVNCAKHILFNKHITKVYYFHDYDDIESVKIMFAHNNIQLIKLDEERMK